jgi:hypothetical protein
MYMPSHAGDGVAGAIWPWRDADTGPCQNHTYDWSRDIPALYVGMMGNI